ncbi:hypothetical protein [Actinopolymorpha alba]|uniref:hypothetical protein n=1 Tax=Actinopolymorpha alba TaxID=533267 RepID=UPI00037B1292|nr:hypothetical protein [Actinopolymorpha alba]
MTEPKHAREIKGKGRYYGACGEGCPFGGDLLISVTNAQSVVNKPALPPSAAKVTAETAWELLPQMVATSRQGPNGPNGCDKKRVAERCGTCRFCVTSAMKAEYKAQWESKADLGTAVHAHAHAHVFGQPMPYDERVEPFIDQYLRFLDAWQVDIDRHVEAAETTVIDRKNRYAGTGDIWLQLPTGRAMRRELWLIDIKTSLTKPPTAVYPDQVLQLAGLRFAPSAVLPDDSEIDVPRFAGAALLNLRTNAHALIPLPADRDAHKAFVNAVALQGYFHGLDAKAWTPFDVPALPEPKSRKAA